MVLNLHKYFKGRVKMPILVLIGSALLANLLMKLWKWDEPIETDLMMYCMGGHTFHIGKLLYTDLWDQKPPLLHMIFGLSETLFGYGKGEVAGVNLIFSSIFIIEAYILAARFVRSKIMQGGLLFFVVFGLISNIDLEANQPNCELLLNAIFGALFLLATKKGSVRKIDAVAFGLLAVSATMIKQHAVIPVLMLGLAYSLNGWDNKRKAGFQWSPIFLSIVLILAGWVSLAAYYALKGHFYDLWLCLVAANATYNPDYLGTLLKALSPGNLSFLLLSFLGSIAAIIGGGNFFEKQKLSTAANILFSLGCYLMLAIPGMWWPHYYQLMEWPVFISMAMMLAVAEEISNRRVAFAMVSLIVAFVAGVSCLNLKNYLILSSRQISERKYNGSWYYDTEIVAPYLSSLMKKDEWFFVWGQDTGLYVYTNIWPRTRFNAYFAFIVSKVQDKVYPIFFNDVFKSPPDVVVFPRPQIGMIGPNIRDPIINWVANNYFPITSGSECQGYLICARLGSNIDERTPPALPRRPLIKYFEP